MYSRRPHPESHEGRIESCSLYDLNHLSLVPMNLMNLMKGELKGSYAKASIISMLCSNLMKGELKEEWHAILATLRASI